MTDDKDDLARIKRILLNRQPDKLSDGIALCDRVQARIAALEAENARLQNDMAKVGKLADETLEHLSALAPAPAPEPADDLRERVAFQERVEPWMQECFGAEVSADREERGDRLLEEVFELLQSGGYNPARVTALRDYVWDREIGEPSQEVGGVMVTLAAYCLAHGLDMHSAGEVELARVWTKVDKIRAKQASKPKGSALPVALPARVSVAEAARDALSRLPDGEWEVWTSCSFRRISRKWGGDGDVLHALTHRSDGHPDLSWNEKQCQALCDLVNGLRRALASAEGGEA